MTNIGTTYINKSSNWWLYVEDSILIWSLIQYVDGTITICIELALGLFWHNLHFFNTHSKNKILSMLRLHKLISYWIDVVTTFIKVEFQCLWRTLAWNLSFIMAWIAYLLFHFWYYDLPSRKTTIALDALLNHLKVNISLSPFYCVIASFCDLVIQNYDSLRSRHNSCNQWHICNF